MGININYATGDSSASGTNQTAVTEQATQAVTQAASPQTKHGIFYTDHNLQQSAHPYSLMRIFYCSPSSV